MSRNLLHINDLPALKDWLNAQGIAYRAPARPRSSPYLVLQIRHRGHWMGVFERHRMPEHYSLDQRLDPLIRRFYREKHAGRPS